MSEPATGADVPLVFEWAPPRGEKFLITVFILSSIFLHGLAFYVFRIIYPPAIAVLPPPARVTFIGSTSNEGRTLLRWIESEDPALASATVRPPEAKLRALPKLAHVPSYVMQEPKLTDPPPSPAVITKADAFPPGPAPIQHQPEPSWPRINTRGLFSDELKGLGQPQLAPPQFTSSSAEPPENMQFRIAVNQNGEIRFCFRVRSSGDAMLDEQARLWLIRSRFPARTEQTNSDERKLTWGVATIEWGNDITQPNRQSLPAKP